MDQVGGRTKDSAMASERHCDSPKTGAAVEAQCHRHGCAAVRVAGTEGGTLVEFALVVPLMVGLVLAIFTFGMGFQNYLVLTNAIGAGARALALSRGSTTITDPCATAISTVYAAAPNLSQSNFTFSIVLTTPASGSGGTSSSTTYTDTCKITDLSEGQTAQLTATYPIVVNLYGWAPQKLNLSATTAELVQ